MNLSNFVNKPSLPKSFGGFFFIFEGIFIYSEFFRILLPLVKLSPLKAEPHLPLVTHTGGFVCSFAFFAWICVLADLTHLLSAFWNDSVADPAAVLFTLFH